MNCEFELQLEIADGIYIEKELHHTDLHLLRVDVTTSDILVFCDISRILLGLLMVNTPLI